jgi:hypothetical protein
MGRILTPGRLALGLLLLPLAVYLGVYLRFSLDPQPVLSQPADADRAMARLRAAVDDQPPGAKLPGKTLPGGLPVWATVYLDGYPVTRHRAVGQTLDEVVGKLERQLRSDPKIRRMSAAERERTRIKLDLASASGPIFTKVPLAFAKSVVPGLDGLGLTVDGRTAYLLPDDLFRRQWLAGHQPFFFMHEFRTGLALKQVVNLLAEELELSREQWREADREFFRFRTQSFVEAPAGPTRRALPVLRSRVPVRRINRATVRQAVTRAADYVLRQIQRDGKFHYKYYPIDGRHSAPGDYSLPRHAGTTWFLSLAYRALKHERFKVGAERAIRYLGSHAVPGACRTTPYACVGSDHYADLGSAALAVVAIAEYQRATADRQYEPLARRLGRFIVWMQKESGDFCHQYVPSKREKRCDDVLLYYSGEASLALAKLYSMTKDRTYLGPLERAMDFLTGAKYDFFLGKFFVSEDHWTCIAAEAVPPSLYKDSYAKLCYAFAGLNRRAQVHPGSGLMDDLHGAFSITPFFMPHNTPAGSRTEANVATYLLSVKRKEPQPEILDTVLRAVRYLVDQQIRPESAYLYRRPGDAVGGMLQTPIRASIRIDYVQHAAAAMTRALPLVPEQWWTPAD